MTHDIPNPVTSIKIINQSEVIAQSSTNKGSSFSFSQASKFGGIPRKAATQSGKVPPASAKTKKRTIANERQVESFDIRSGVGST